MMRLEQLRHEADLKAKAYVVAAPTDEAKRLQEWEGIEQDYFNLLHAMRAAGASPFDAFQL